MVYVFGFLLQSGVVKVFYVCEFRMSVLLFTLSFKVLSLIYRVWCDFFLFILRRLLLIQLCPVIFF